MLPNHLQPFLVHWRKMNPNLSTEEIRQALAKAGWTEQEITEGLEFLAQKEAPVSKPQIAPESVGMVVKPSFKPPDSHQPKKNHHMVKLVTVSVIVLGIIFTSYSFLEAKYGKSLSFTKILEDVTRLATDLVSNSEPEPVQTTEKFKSAPKLKTLEERLAEEEAQSVPETEAIQNIDLVPRSTPTQTTNQASQQNFAHVPPEPVISTGGIGGSPDITETATTTLTTETSTLTSTDTSLESEVEDVAPIVISKPEPARVSYAPFIHQPLFQGEREIYGYAPAYSPGVTSFDKNNVMYMRSMDGDLQKFVNGSWTELDYTSDINNYFAQTGKNWNGEVEYSAFTYGRVVFDSSNDGYMIVIALLNGQRTPLLLYTNDQGGSWKVYALTHHLSLLQTGSPNNPVTEPPVLIEYDQNKKDIYLRFIEKSGSGLVLGDRILINDNAYYYTYHSGSSNAVIRVGDRAFVVYAAVDSLVKPNGVNPVSTPQYIVEVSKSSKQIVNGPVLIGTNGHSLQTDEHDIPSIDVDSSGYLHVVLGAHHGNLYHYKSTSPYNISSWEDPEQFGGVIVPGVSGGHTYPALLIDDEDNIHVVTRYAGDGYHFNLVHNKKSGNSWDSQKNLVVAFKPFYGIWYHKLSYDSLGNMYLSYEYYAGQLFKSEAEAYVERWPEDGLTISPPGTVASDNYYSTYLNIKPHDPVVIVSKDNGDSWSLFDSDSIVSSPNKNSAKNNLATVVSTEKTSIFQKFIQTIVSYLEYILDLLLFMF